MRGLAGRDEDQPGSPLAVLRLAILVTLVLLLPDLYILHMGEPAKGIFVVIAMHVAIALVTYNLLVHLAPARPRPVAHRPRPQARCPQSGAVSPAAGRGAPVAEQLTRGRHRHAR